MNNIIIFTYAKTAEIITIVLSNLFKSTTRIKNTIKTYNGISFFEIAFFKFKIKHIKIAKKYNPQHIIVVVRAVPSLYIALTSTCTSTFINNIKSITIISIIVVA